MTLGIRRNHCQISSRAHDCRIYRVRRAGWPIARRIAGGRFPLRLWSRRPESTAQFLDVAQGIDATPAELASRCDVLGVCVNSDQDVEAVPSGEHGVLAGARNGLVVIVHSTVNPGTVRPLAAKAEAIGAHLLDAPASGSPAGAAAGTMAILAGGEAAVLERVRPVFATFASNIFLLGLSARARP